MLTTIWLIISAMFFGGMMEKSGSLNVLAQYLMVGVRSGGALMRRAGMTSLVANLVTSDQYLSIAIPSRMFADNFQEMSLKTKNLSRVLEDFGTVTSVLVPWNTCGAFMAGTLGVPTFAYLPFAFFNLINPLVAIFYGFRDIKITRIEEDTQTEEVESFARTLHKDE